MATAMLACARLGLRAGLVGAVGCDLAGEVALSPLRDGGVDVSGVRALPDVGTRSAVVLVDRESGERTVLGHLDPALRVPPGSLSAEEVARARVLHVDASDLDASIEAAEIARRERIPVVLDADAPVPGIEALLRKVDFPIVSLDFADAYGGARVPEQCVRALVAQGARFAVVTLGDQGAIGGGEAMVRCPGVPVPVRDTTGAGDVFHAGFVWGLLQGYEAEQVLQTANALAAMSCRAVGAQGGLATEAELSAFLRAHPSDA